MGRVLLASLSPTERTRHLGDLEALTPHTITDPHDLDRALRDVAAQGWALVDEELEEGLRSIAVAIRDHTGRVVAAINVSAPARQGTPADLRAALLPELQRTAARIEAELGLRGPAVTAG